MNFLQPWMLLGMLAAAVPIVIHMINRRKAQRVDFPMLDFVQRSQKKVARRLHLKRWLLLLARVAILMLIPLAMAQPYALCGGSGGVQSDRMPAAVVVIIDGSSSMSFSEDGRSLLDRARDEARKTLRALRPWDQARVLVAQDEPLWLTDRWGVDASASIRALDDYEFAGGSASLPKALLEARTELFASTQPARRVVLITDNAHQAWMDEALRPELLEGMGELVVLPLRPEDPSRQGVIIESLAWEESSSAADLIDLRALLRASGRGEQNLRVRLEVDGTPVSMQQVAIEDESTLEVVFSHAFAGDGVHQVRVSLDDERGVKALQERVMPVHLSRAVRALLVNGAASSVQRNDELFYLERALMVDVGERQAIGYQVTTPDRLAAQDLNAFDVVLLANVASLPAESVQRLHGFVEAGGGLWITAGAMVDPERYNTTLAALLPRPIRTVTRLSSIDDPDANIRATRFAHIDHTGPLFRIFSMAGGESLQSARVFSYLQLDPELDSTARVLASFGDGGPAVLERTIGAGRVLFWTTSVDLDWTDLPIRTAYLPLVHRTLRYLAQRGSSSSLYAEVGALMRLDLSGLGVERVEIAGPDDRRWSLPVEGDAVALAPPRAGVYSVSLVKGGVTTPAPELTFAANAPLVEATLDAVADDFVATWTTAASEGFVTGAGEDVEANRRRVWPALLLVALFMLYLESLLSVRRRVWESVRVFSRSR